MTMLEGEENEYLTRRDALIKRFEFCYDLTWKFLKTFLLVRDGIDLASPRKVFQESYKLKILDDTASELFLALADFRNQTAHIYSEEMSEQVAQYIERRYAEISATIARCNPQFI